MTSLPIPANGPEQALALPAPGLRHAILGGSGSDQEQFLLRAFRSFSEAAASLEHSYRDLRLEVQALRRALEEANRDLAESLEENRSMRVHLDRILESLPCGVLVVAGDGRISEANPEARRLFASATGAEACSTLDALPLALRELLERARREGGEAERSLGWRDGSCRWLAARHASIPATPGEASVFILHDVTDRKRLEETQARLRRDQALAEMSTVLAHEMRNPLGSLELFAGLLAESPLSPDGRNWVDQIQAGLRTLAATVNNVLHFHSLPEPVCVPVDLGELLVWAQDFFRPLARQSGIALRVENRLSGIFLWADRHRFEQVLLNLVLNSVRAMPRGGWIELRGRTADDGRCIAIEVADDGPGICAQDLPHIFEPNFSTHAGSSGLGLAVCQKIVRQHAGSIAVTSPPGHGATFTLNFPRTPLPSHANGGSRA